MDNEIQNQSIIRINLMEKKKIIYVFSHSNYLIKNTGTERYMKSLYSTYQLESVNIINVFPIAMLSKVPHLKSYLGVNYNDNFIGVLKIEDILYRNICFSSSDRVEIKGIHIQHFHNLPSKKIINFLISKKIKCNVFIHDTYSLGYLGQNYIPRVFKNYESVFKRIKSNIEGVYFPSKYICDLWNTTFKLEKYSIIREPLIVHSHKKEIHKQNFHPQKINIAFLGKQLAIKGYDEWTYLMENLNMNNKDSYNFFYLGNDNNIIAGVTNVYVDNVNSFMSEKIHEYKIDCVFLWSKVKESFSYVFHEALVNNCFVVTSNLSGNIVELINRYKNGIVYNKIEDLLNDLEKPAKFKDLVSSYLNNNSIYYTINDNRDISSIRAISIETSLKPYRKTLLSRLLTKVYIKKNKIIKQKSI